ncbi:MAG: hypothetical protein NT139_01275 [Candidatus Woesearchaeota archaeon]|nr:hypothetical protein [Candidatus Woesearchaeota archaeon]
MYTITFDREANGLEESLYDMAVENTFKRNCSFISSFKRLGSLADLGDGVLGMDSELYELKGQGAILYQKIVTVAAGYNVKVFLIGFDEKNNEAFKELKGRLEELLMTDDIEVIKSKFLEKRL